MGIKSLRNKLIIHGSILLLHVVLFFAVITSLSTYSQTAASELQSVLSLFCYYGFLVLMIGTAVEFLISAVRFLVAMVKQRKKERFEQERGLSEETVQQNFVEEQENSQQL